MTEHRRSARCEECGLIREMATRQLCYRCYRRHARAKERLAEDPYSDFTTSPISRDGKRVLAGYQKLVSALADLRVSPDGCREVIDIIRPWLKSARAWLNVDRQIETDTPDDIDIPVGEREQAVDVHVHGDADDDDLGASRFTVVKGAK